MLYYHIKHENCPEEKKKQQKNENNFFLQLKNKKAGRLPPEAEEMFHFKALKWPLLQLKARISRQLLR